MTGLAQVRRRRWGAVPEGRRSRWTGRGVVAAVLLAGWVLLAGARPAEAWRGRKGDLKHQVEELEEKWRAAQLAGDVSTMDHMLSDDFVGITMSGQVVTKPQQMERIRTRELVLTRLDLNDVRVKLVGHIAVVTVLARVEGVNNGHPLNGEYRYTRVYQQLATGAWKITNFEATHIARDRGRGANSAGTTG